MDVIFKIALSAALALLSGCDAPVSGPPAQEIDLDVRVGTDDLQRHHVVAANESENTYRFGFDLRGAPQEDVAQYVPFLSYLESATGYRFKLHFTPKNSSTVEEIGSGNIDFAAMGASGFLRARSKHDAVSLVRGVNHLGRAEYQSVLVVAPDSDIQRIDQVRGRRLAFGDRDSTQGHLIPRIMLTEYGIQLSDFQAVTYTGSHQKCAEAVVSGLYDVCGMQDQLAKTLELRGSVRIIHTSPYFPSSGIVATGGISQEVRERVKAALLTFDPVSKHRDDLYNWERTEMPRGFVEANEEDYRNLYDWSVRLGFLDGEVQAE